MLNTTLINRYQITRELGRGGMGTVYLAMDTYLEREVAVKIIDHHKFGTEGRALLIHEARATARLSHPNVVMVFDVGELDRVPFVVMEYVQGPTLAEEKPHRLNEIVRLARQVCAALSHAHAKGLIHRDVKPGNVLVTPEGVAKLMDFGLARASNAKVEPDNSFAGTVAYVAPEQAMGEEIDPRADLYALGVMLYELCTGHLPFTGSSMQIIIKHIQEMPKPPQEVNPDLPSALNELILHLLQKNPDDRPGSAEGVGHLLGILGDLYRMSFVH
jgi:eukaryotic-like serine/threonine-protein kinase